jgi:hypothetical protein
MTTYTMLKVMADWKCWPLWPVRADGGLENPDPRELGLPDELAERVIGWGRTYDSRIDPEDFEAPLFDNPSDGSAFAEEGLGLAREVAEAVGGRFGLVRFYYPEDGRIVDVS